MTDPLIIFDCDGVLVDSELLSARAYAAVFAGRGVDITLDVFEQFIGMQQRDILDRIEEISGYRLPRDEEHVLWDEIRALFRRELQTTPGLVPFLDHLAARRCVGSSSSPERIALSLDLTGLTRYFGTDLYSASMVRNGKPAPDLFLLAAERCATPPDRCIVIEDSRHGITAARAAGMVGIGYTGGAHSYDGHAGRLAAAGAHAVCGSWDEVAAVLRRLG